MLVATLLREAGRHLGSVLSTVVNILNPGVIVIGGSIATVGDGLIAGVREIVYSRSTSLATKDLKIIPSTLGSRSGVIGCRRSILDELFSEAHIASVLEEVAVTKENQNFTTTTVERNSDAQVRV
jgi:predicted NBD/HSP70 family sugar kinase